MKKALMLSGLIILLLTSCAKDRQCTCTCTPGICSACATPPSSSSYSPILTHETTEKKAKAVCDSYDGKSPDGYPASTLTDCQIVN